MSEQVQDRFINLVFTNIAAPPDSWVMHVCKRTESSLFFDLSRVMLFYTTISRTKCIKGHWKTIGKILIRVNGFKSLMQNYNQVNLVSAEKQRFILCILSVLMPLTVGCQKGWIWRGDLSFLGSFSLHNNMKPNFACLQFQNQINYFSISTANCTGGKWLESDNFWKVSSHEHLLGMLCSAPVQVCRENV